MTRCTNLGQKQINADDAPVPDSEKRPDGQHKDHWVLCETERAKGFVRPVRLSYIHVGPPLSKNPLRDLTEEEHKRYGQCGYVKYEEYPEGNGSVLGMFWTQERLDRANKGCNVKTSMPTAIAETYARKPDYYGSTFCCGCNKYLPVGAQGEFIWADGSNERVGT